MDERLDERTDVHMMDGYGRTYSLSGTCAVYYLVIELMGGIHFSDYLPIAFP